MSVALGIDPAALDSDGDGLTNADEVRLGTDPFKPDTDGVPFMPDFNTGYRIPVISQAKSLSGNRGNAKEADENIRRLVSKIEDHMDEFADVQVYGDKKAETAFVTFGSVCRAARSL